MTTVNYLKKARKCINGIFTDEIKRNIVMVVGNGINGDSRVIKSAKFLQDNNFNVILIGTKPMPVEYKTLEIDDVQCLLVNSIEFKGLQDKSSEEHFAVTKKIAKRINDVLIVAQFGILYTHDFWGLDYGASIIASNYKKEKFFWIHDIHEFIDGYEGILPAGRLEYAQIVEQNHIKLPDELIVVNEKIAHLIKTKYNLVHLNELILHNAPRKQLESNFQLREAIGLPDDIPLGVYLGRATQPRGLDIIIPVLQAIPELHIALLSSGHVGYLDSLKEKAKKFNILNRLHVFDYVPDNEVSNAVESASFGISPLTRYGNTDLAIATKILEYIHADLPILVSDATFQKEFIEEHDIGVVFESENAEDAIKAFKQIISISQKQFTIPSYLKEKYTWESQYQPIIDKLEKFSCSGVIRNRKIIHGIGPSAGQPYGLSKALRKYGSYAESISVVQNNKFLLQADNLWSTKSIKEHASLIKWIVDRFDIVHLHFRPIMNYIIDKQYSSPSFIDFEIFKQSRKKLVFTFRGSEIRINKEFKEKNPFAWDEVDDPTFATMNDLTKIELRKRVREMADLILVPDPELQTYIPEAKILPRIIDTNKLKFVGQVNKQKPLIVHAPTRRGAKGTNRVLSAIETLKEKGYQFDFELLENLPHDTLIDKLKEADIVIDQLLIGWYGVLGLEAMTLGKVTLAYIREDIQNSIPNLPIVNVNPNNLTKELAEIIEDDKLREEIGKKSRTFVEEYHSEEVISDLLLNYYKDLEIKYTYSEAFLDQEINSINKYRGKIKQLEKNTISKESIVYKDKIIYKDEIVHRKKLLDKPYRKIPFRIYRRIFNKPIQ